MSIDTTELNFPAEGLEIINDLIERYYKKIVQEIDQNIKPGDLLKMIELRQKLKPTKSEEEAFWSKIAKIRRDSHKSELKQNNTTAPGRKSSAKREASE